MKATIEGPYGEFAKMDAMKQVTMVRALKGRDEDVRVKTDELAAKDGEIQQLRHQLEQAQVPESQAQIQFSYYYSVYCKSSVSSLNTATLTVYSYKLDSHNDVISVV